MLSLQERRQKDVPVALTGKELSRRYHLSNVLCWAQPPSSSKDERERSQGPVVDLKWHLALVLGLLVSQQIWHLVCVLSRRHSFSYAVSIGCCHQVVQQP